MYLKHIMVSTAPSTYVNIKSTNKCSSLISFRDAQLSRCCIMIMIIANDIIANSSMIILGYNVLITMSFTLVPSKNLTLCFASSSVLNVSLHDAPNNEFCHASTHFQKNNQCFCCITNLSRSPGKVLLTIRQFFIKYMFYLLDSARFSVKYTNVFASPRLLV